MKKITIKMMIPNMLTAGNLWLGFLAIISAFEGNIRASCLFILVAAFLDGLDGKAARKLNVASEFGKELDSLSDLISFGAAPAILAYSHGLKDMGFLGLLAVILYVTAGAFRLARFNVLNISTHFLGIPITIAGAFLAFVILFGSALPITVILIVTLLLAWLMISNFVIPKI